MIPLLHDLTGARVLIFGGGPVGARRARTFSREAEVVVLSPTFVEKSFGTATRIRAAPDPAGVGGWIDRVEPAVVVAATNTKAVNNAVANAARNRNLLINRADRSQSDSNTGAGWDVNDVAVPATVWSEPVVVGISSGGRSPALSRVLRERIEPEIEGAGALARITGELRRELDEYPPQQRRAAVRAVVRSDRVWKALGGGRENTEQVVNELIVAELGETK